MTYILLFMALQALNITLSKKPTQLPTVWKFSSHNMIYVTNPMNGGWRLEFKLYSKP
jgi:hypothetical protein